MKTLREIEWRAIASATRWFLAAIGACVLLAWFYSQRNWMLAAPAAIVLAGIWYAIYRIVLATRNRQMATNRLARAWSAGATGGETHAGLRKARRGGVTAGDHRSVSGPARSVPQDDSAPLKWRHIGFDPDTGDEIRKLEVAL